MNTLEVGTILWQYQYKNDRLDEGIELHKNIIDSIKPLDTPAESIVTKDQINTAICGITDETRKEATNEGYMGSMYLEDVLKEYGLTPMEAAIQFAQEQQKGMNRHERYRISMKEKGIVDAFIDACQHTKMETNVNGS
jgi:hypothetical protein